MYEKLENCPVCKNTQFTNHLICTDHTVTGESFALVKCSNCKLIFTNPRPAEEKLSEYYKSDQYISHTDKANSLINVAYKIIRTHTLKKKKNLIKKYVETSSLLDFGCGTGDFLLTCKKDGWDTYGFEPDENASDISKQKGLEVISEIEKLDLVNAITAWHVIEHVSNLKEVIKLLTKKLKKGGVFIIAVPNNNSYDAIYYKENWAAYDVPRHLYHFTQKSFGKLIAESKLKLIDTLPMKFDSYYVSLLSEKNKSGKSNILNALRVGLKSNREAKKTGEYSSLIYVLQK